MFSTSALYFKEGYNLQAKKQRKSRYVKVPLSPEQPHMRLHLYIEMSIMMAMARILWVVTVLAHFSNSI